MAEADSTAHWLLPHINQQSPSLELLPTVARFKDFLKSGRIGQLAAGIGYLYMEARQYPFGMHWEDAPSRPAARKPTGRNPDFIFVDSQRHWVLMESKGTLSRSLAHICRTTESGYEEQIDPYVDSQGNQARVSHGFALGVHATPGSRASLVAVRTPRVDVPVRPDAPVEPALADPATIAACFRPAFALMGLSDIVRSIDAKQPIGEVPSLREFGLPGMRVLATQEAFRRASSGRTEIAGRFAGIFGIEKRIGEAVLNALRQERRHDPIPVPIAPLSQEAVDPINRAGGLSVSRDGLMWVGIERFGHLSGLPILGLRGPTASIYHHATATSSSRDLQEAYARLLLTTPFEREPK